MKTKLFLLMLLSVALLFVTQSVQANYFYNPGFEDDVDDNDIPDQWDPWGGGGGGWAYIEGDPDGAHGGEDYLELYSGPGGWCGIHRHNFLIEDDEIAPDRGYNREINHCWTLSALASCS